MRIRRFYRRGVNYPYTISDEYLAELIKTKGDLEAAKIDNSNSEIVLESVEEEIAWFNECCNRVYENPRWYLDNLDFLITFRVKKGNIYK